MTIQSDSFKNFSLPKPIIYPVKIKKILNHTDTIKSIYLKLPKDSNFKFICGQYIDIKFLNTPTT